MTQPLSGNSRSAFGNPQFPITVIQPTRGLASLQLGAVWQYRELLMFLV
ncbi:MAG TPA: hypothetical protein PKW05_09120 [Anaerolineae bacterium]|nr:hypothetical protein [Anaerolineae bacterium]